MARGADELVALEDGGEVLGRGEAEVVGDAGDVVRGQEGDGALDFLAQPILGGRNAELALEPGLEAGLGEPRDLGQFAHAHRLVEMRIDVGEHALQER